MMHNVSKKIDVINGLRGLAILSVIFEHTISHPISKMFSTPFIVQNGWVGVNLFFILSGFVLYRPYFTGERKFENKTDVFNFYKNRFFRLYPLFFFVSLVSLIFIYNIHPHTLIMFVQTLSTFSMFDKEQFFPYLNGPFWSLILEIWFSVLFPVMLFTIARIGFWRFFMLVFCASLLVRFAGLYGTWPNGNINPIKDSVLGRLDDFLLGMLICRLYYRNSAVFRINSLLLGTGTFLFILAGCLLWDYKNLLEGSIFIIPFTNNIFQVGFFALIILALKENNPASYIFRLRSLQLAGLMCFSIYAWHYMLAKIIVPEPSISRYTLYFMFTFIISAFSYRYIEFGKERNWRKLFLLR